MEIHFRNKEESKHEQEEAFLQLSDSERVEAFIKLSSNINGLFPSKVRTSENENFVIYKEKRRMDWGEEIKAFLLACQEEHVEMILVGGGAVNF